MARSQAGETKAPVVIALAFFVLTTLALGVLTYMAYGDLALANEEVKKKVADADAAKGLQSKAEQKAIFYKAVIGVPLDKAESDVFEGLKSSDVAKAEYAAFTDALTNRLSGAQGLVSQQANAIRTKTGGGFTVTLDELLGWDLKDGKTVPSKQIIEQMVTLHADKVLAQRMDKIRETQNQVSKDAASAAEKLYKDAAAKLEAEYAALPKKVEDAAKKYADLATNAQKTFQADTAGYIEKLRKFEADIAQKDLDNQRASEDLRKARTVIANQEAELSTREDPFEFDKPHGKIVRRRSDNTVEIDLGSADNLKPGLKFAVQPSDTPTRGFDSRKRVVVTPDGRREVQVIAKGKIEIIQNLGPHLAQARIVEEKDRVREGIVGGDLLYNSVWRKGEPDHVALVGVFDLDGDGTDDVKVLARDLTRMGIVVDAYFDLDQKKWLSPDGGPGRLSERTIYAIEGNVPFKDTQAGEPPAILEAKAAILKAIGDARAQVKERGTKLIRMRDFFPRIGYPVNLDVEERRINQAAARYLKAATAPVEPGM